MRGWRKRRVESCAQPGEEMTYDYVRLKAQMRRAARTTGEGSCADGNGSKGYYEEASPSPFLATIQPLGTHPPEPITGYEKEGLGTNT